MVGLKAGFIYIKARADEIAATSLPFPATEGRERHIRLVPRQGIG